MSRCASDVKRSFGLDFAFLQEICPAGSARGDAHKRHSRKARPYHHNMSHEWTMKFIEHRVADRRVLRLIQKWLKAGVSEDGQWSETKLGTPQGAVVSPLLANVYCITCSTYGLRSGARKWRKAM